MIDPAYQWCQQIDVTNACGRKCSNCTRLCGHVRDPFYMSVEMFAQCVEALRNFPTDSPPSTADPNKMIGMIGGEPLLHPEFAKLVRIVADRIPNKEHRGLWTGLRWERTIHAALIRSTFGYINNNTHDSKCQHSPVLVAIQDYAKDTQNQTAIIEQCWLQRLWSATCTPKGYFFCEVAGALDMVMNGPGGLPIEPGCWDRPLADFQEQIDRWCPRCGIPLQLEGRLDSDEVDDISPTNLDALRHSPRITNGHFVLHTHLVSPIDNAPWKYLK
jgi:hypothetical protein